MRDGFFITSDGDKIMQSLYYPIDHPTMPGWFKGMEQILWECRLWRDGLLALCGGSGFSCKNSDTNNCCCRKTLFCQVDFQTQKSKLKEIIESRGHICDFYPKFHCELNLLNSIGELQNCVTVGLPGWSGQWLWSRMSKNVLMVFHLSKFIGMIILFPILGN